MLSVEQEAKQRFVRLFKREDAPLFKAMAEYYLRAAVVLQKKHVDADRNLRLLARNCQKRLFLGIGIGLLLKAVYLQRGYSINELRSPKAAGAPRFPFTFQQVNASQQSDDKTYMTDRLITNLEDVLQQQVDDNTKRGLRIAKVFRNKEGHVVLPTHNAVDSDYRDIEHALRAIYRQAFNQQLRIRISFRPNEKPM